MGCSAPNRLRLGGCPFAFSCNTSCRAATADSPGFDLDLSLGLTAAEAIDVVAAPANDEGEAKPREDDGDGEDEVAEANADESGARDSLDRLIFFFFFVVVVGAAAAAAAVAVVGLTAFAPACVACTALGEIVCRAGDERSIMT